MSVKVLQIVIASHLPSPNGSISVTGPERRAANLSHRWVSHGIEPVVCYPARGNLNHVFKGAQLKVIDFEIGSKFNAVAVWRLYRLISSEGVHVVHTQGPASLDLIASFACLWAGIPLVITRPVMLEDQISYSALRRKIYSVVDRVITLSLTDRVIAVSERGFNHLNRHCGVEEKRLTLIWNGIDLRRISARDYEAVTCRETEKVPVRFGMVAQLFPPKGWFDFLEVIAGLKRRGNSVRGIIVGDGPLRNFLLQRVHDLDLADEVVFEGFVEDVRTVLKSFDVFLFTSHREGLSVAVIEALATGLPIVATDVGGIREQVVDGLNGLIVDVGDIEMIVRACEGLVADREQRRRMGVESRKIAEQRFSEDRMLEQYAECYRAAWRGGM